MLILSIFLASNYSWEYRLYKMIYSSILCKIIYNYMLKSWSQSVGEIPLTAWMNLAADCVYSYVLFQFTENIFPFYCWFCWCSQGSALVWQHSHVPQGTVECCLDKTFLVMQQAVAMVKLYNKSSCHMGTVQPKMKILLSLIHLVWHSSMEFKRRC